MITELIWVEGDGRLDLKTSSLFYRATFGRWRMVVMKSTLKELDQYVSSYIEYNSNEWIFVNNT